MKRFLFFLLVLITFPLLIHSQALVFDAVLESLMAATHAENIIYYAQMVDQGFQEIEHFRYMVENTGKQIDMAVQNLKSIEDIKSWDDFMDWYNMQLYLERQAMETWDNMSVKIGKKDYKLTDVYGIAEGLKDTHIDYWNKEFTEEQRKEMWLGLGLTPANYAYVQPFRAKANEITKRNLTRVQIQNGTYMKNMEKNRDRQKKLAEDHLKSKENQLGSKELLMMTLESLLETNKALNDMAMNQAMEMEEKAVKEALDKAPKTDPPLANWRTDGFESF